MSSLAALRSRQSVVHNSHHSALVPSRQERHISAHEQLYQEATRRLQRRAQYEGVLPEDYTFAPRILRRAPESCKITRGPGRHDADADLAER